MIPGPAYEPSVSVIIPVRNGETTLGTCLRAVSRSSYGKTELIVVDDHSTDQSRAVAEQFHCTVLGTGNGSGANVARNLGASRARGDILVFIDSDIVVGRNTILEIVETLQDENVDAVVGIYTARHRHESLVSQYKNLWVRYSYIKSLPAIDWFFGSISGIRRPAFETLGGFNVELLARHGHDDVELGKRLARARLNIFLNMDLEVEHLKQYTVTSFVKNEFHRSVGFARLAVQFGETARSFRRGFVNVYPMFVLSTIISVCIAALGILWGAGAIPRWMFLVPAGLYCAMNIRFLNYLEQVRGLFAMLVMIPFLYIDHLICFVGGVTGTIQGIIRRFTGARREAEIL
jgi:glycosyltransferase involved in cell wall biosynthesis